MQKGEVPLMAVALLLRWEWSCTRPSSLSKLSALFCKFPANLDCKFPRLVARQTRQWAVSRPNKTCSQVLYPVLAKCGQHMWWHSVFMSSEVPPTRRKLEEQTAGVERFASKWTDRAWWIASCLELWRTMLTPLSSTPGASSYCWYVENLETQHKGASWMGPVTRCRTKLFITQKNKMHADLTCIGALCQDCG